MNVDDIKGRKATDESTATINLTAMFKQDLDDAKHTLIPASAEHTSAYFNGSYLLCKVEDNKHTPTGKALAVYSGSTRIGFIPELNTLKDKGLKAKASGNTDDYKKYRERYPNVAKVRKWFADTGEQEAPCNLEYIKFKRGEHLMEYPIGQDDWDGVEVASIVVNVKLKEEK